MRWTGCAYKQFSHAHKHQQRWAVLMLTPHRHCVYTAHIERFSTIRSNLTFVSIIFLKIHSQRTNSLNCLTGTSYEWVLNGLKKVNDTLLSLQHIIRNVHDLAYQFNKQQPLLWSISFLLRIKWDILKMYPILPLEYFQWKSWLFHLTKNIRIFEQNTGKFERNFHIFIE